MFHQQIGQIENLDNPQLDSLILKLQSKQPLSFEDNMLLETFRGLIRTHDTKQMHNQTLVQAPTQDR